MPDTWSRERILQNNQSIVIYLLYLNCAEMLATYNLKYTYIGEGFISLGSHKRDLECPFTQKLYFRQFPYLKEYAFLYLLSL